MASKPFRDLVSEGIARYYDEEPEAPERGIELRGGGADGRLLLAVPTGADTNDAVASGEWLVGRGVEVRA